MFPGTSPKKRKNENEDNDLESEDQSIWHGGSDYPGANMEHDDMPSGSTKRPRLNSLQGTTTACSTNNLSTTLPRQGERIQRIREIISQEFSREMKAKEAQLELADERLEEAKNLLERLRYAIVAEYYKKQEQTQTMIDVATAMRGENAMNDSREQLPQIPLHPSLKKIIGKRPQRLAEIMRACPKREAAKNAKHVLNTKSAAERREEKRLQKVIREKGIVIDHTKQKDKEGQAVQSESKEITKSSHCVKTEPGSSRLEAPPPHVLNNARMSNKLKCHFVVGNTSKYIGKNDERAQVAGSTSFSHKWLVYVQTKDTEVPIEKYVKKVRFFLHPSYRPNDVVDIHEPPFQVARRGWGEFPMRIQLFFHDRFQQKPLQLVHKVVLDTSKSGRHTLGAETVVEIWLRSEVVPTVEEPIKREHVSPAISTTTTTAASTVVTSATPETSRKPRTISFNIKETFDDNFFDFLNKIEESRTSICADIEKIEPTLLVNEPLEPQFSNTLRSPVKNELLRSPLKLTPLLHSPVKRITTHLSPQNTHITDEKNTVVTKPPILPKAIKEATLKLSAAISQNNVEPHGQTHIKERVDLNFWNQTAQMNAKNRNALLTSNVTTATTIANNKTTSNKTSFEATATPSTTKTITNSNNTKSIPPISGKIFNNVSGTIILPVTKSQSPQQPTTQNATPQVPSSTNNKAMFQKKMIQVVNAQGEVKTVQMIIATPKNIPSAGAAKPVNNTLTTSGIRIISSKALSTYTTSTLSDITRNLNSSAQIPTSKFQPITVRAPFNVKPDIPSPQPILPPTTSSQQNHNASSNNAISTLKPLATSISKNVVFQKEGRLYIIDPLQMKLKQQRKNQISLLKPQVKKNTTFQLSVASDHDYAPPPPLRQNSLSLHNNQNTAPIRTPPVHLGMRETRLCALKAQDRQKLQRIQLEKKFYGMKFSNMRSAVEYLLRRLPLTENNKESAALAFPFVRTTTPHEFQSLPAFKQRSFEWLRAKFIARMLQNSKNLQAVHAAGEDTYWSTREIATFARFHAYTPPIKALQQDTVSPDDETVPGSQAHFSALIKTEMKSEQLQLEYDTLSPATHITHWINNMQTRLEEISIDEIITIDDDDECDAVSSNDRSTSKAVVTKRVYGSPLKLQNHKDNLLYLQAPKRLETAFQYVGEICQDISVRLRPEEIVPGILHPSAQTALAHVSQLFIDRLLRQTIANQTLHQQEQYNSNSHLPHNNQERIVTSQDIRKTIAQSAEFDFLTNRNLGVATQRIKNE